MAIAIKICYTHQAPARRKSWTVTTSHINVVVQIPDRGLTRAGITDHPIRMAIAIKVGYSSPGRPGSCRHSKGIDLVVSGVVNAAASDNARIPFPRAGHHFIGSAAGVNHGASVSIV